ncbi:DUF4079 domain-containing protein [Microcoleus sp. B5-D4]|uniref:DUF4079 domain-containing protein n=1 Tax=unclassified Microcoleus TaxID=2642155 RepID=UPI002FCFBA10
MQIRRTRLADGDIKKEMVKGGFAIRHHQIGSILLALMVIRAIGGITVTYINNGKIMVGPRYKPKFVSRAHQVCYCVYWVRE